MKSHETSDENFKNDSDPRGEISDSIKYMKNISSEKKGKIYPDNQGCKMNKVVDESFRIDDNSNYSTTAIAENSCLNDPNVPGIGIEETDLV